MPFPNVPRSLATEEFALRPITAADAARDHAAVMETRTDLRVWEQSSWPAEDFTVEANREDLVDLERRHADGRAFTYTVVDPADTVALGCVYVFSPTASFLAQAAVTPLAGEVWLEQDAVVYFWVRASRAATGMDARLLAALRPWFRDEWKAARTVFVTNELFTHQVGLLERAGLTPAFRFIEPDKPGPYVAFA